MATSNEVAKLQQHLELLREQYIRLQQRYASLEQKYTQVVATSGDVGPDHFVARLIHIISRLYDKPLYSDIDVKLSDKTIGAHKMILCCRSNKWLPDDEELLNTNILDLTHLSPQVANILLRWVYTDAIVMPTVQSATIELLSSANMYQLPQLKDKCEQSLISEVTIRNCIKLYQTSEQYKADQLKDYCLKVISSRWNDLNTADFADLSAPLLYDMFKAHSQYPLHLAIQHLREDVVFMFIIEYNLQLSSKLNELNEFGNIALDLALLVHHEGIANTLISNNCDINNKDANGNTLLYLAITRGDEYSASFLIKNGASTVSSTSDTQESPLHLVANYNQSVAVSQLSKCPISKPPFPNDDLGDIATLLLQYHANPDAQDKHGYTPLQRAIVMNNPQVFNVLLNNPILNLELRNKDSSTALWLALNQLDSSQSINDSQSDTMATRLITRGADPNSTDPITFNTLLHRTILESNEDAAIFLVNHGSNVDCVNKNGEVPIHLAAVKGLHLLTKMLLINNANPNLCTNRKTVVHETPSIVTTPSPQSRMTTPPSRSLMTTPPSQSPTVSAASDSNPFDISSLQQLSFISQYSPQDMRKTPSLAGSTNPFGDSDEDDEPTVQPNPIRDNTPSIIETPTEAINEFIDEPEQFNITIDPGRRTALHLAIINKHTQVIKVLLDHKVVGQHTLDVDILDNNNESPLSLSLWTEQFTIATQLIQYGANIEGINNNTISLLYQSIIREQSNAAIFLLENGADYKKRTPLNATLLLLSIRHQLEEVADRLCDYGCEVGVADASGNSPLWVALRSRQEVIAHKLISQGCDPNAWHSNNNGITLSLLHRAIQLKDIDTACFLIKSGADITKPAIFNDSIYLPPLHLACQIGLTKIVECLVNHHVELNTKDSDGRTALHTSILFKHTQCSAVLLAQPRIDLTISNNKGQTAFAVALVTKDNETGKVILEREPKAAEQIDNKGFNFLHHAVLDNDVESVIFLLSVNVNINSTVQNPTSNTALHFAVKNGSEILVRHLLLAGASVIAVDNHDRSVLHMAVEGDYSAILSILLENSAEPDHTDEEDNNALHSAMMLGRENCVRVLLEDSDINLGAVNINGRNCLHMLAATTKDNSTRMFEMLMKVAPAFPINHQDSDGNTPLLLAYHCGNTALCDCMIQHLAHPGIANKHNISIFNAPVATKQLLFRILDQIRKEPVWLEGQHCMDCNTKFNISHRKHHCRHCGRLLCNKCTSQQIPIIKFDLTKPVRICEICADCFKLTDDI